MARTSGARSDAKTSKFILSSFALGPLTIRIYSLTFVLGILAAYLIGRARALRAGISAKIFDDIIFWTIIAGFLSARIYYVLFYFGLYRDNLAEIYKVWHGGLAIYGGLIGGTIVLYFLCKKYAVDFFKFADLLVIGLPIAQAIGRIGNYFNYEAFGAPTNLPWKMFVPEQFRPPGFQQYAYFHPTFAYEIIWNLIVFALIFFAAKKRPKPGILLGIYLLLYSIGRFAIEAIRLDSAYFGVFRGDQITALLLIICALAIIVSRYVAQANK